MRPILAATFATISLGGMAHAQKNTEPASNDAYMQRVMQAAPPQVVADATVVRMQNNKMETLKKGGNEWTCMFSNGVPMCLDPGAMDWAHAWQSHGPATSETGFIYMLAGDTGASNTDPWAKEKTANNHWVQTGSHVMIVGAAAKTMADLGSYQKVDDPLPSQSRT